MRRKTGVLILLLVVSLTLVACGSKGETPEQAVTNTLNAMKELDYKTLEKYIDDPEAFAEDSGDLEDLESARLLVNRLTFSVISSSVDGESATVKTEITNIDLAEVFSKYFERSMELQFGNAFSEDPISDEEIEAQAEQYLIDLLKEDGHRMVTSSIDIKLTKNDNSWKIETDEQFQDAILGGLLEAFDGFEDFE